MGRSRVQGIAVSRDEGADGGVALRHPGALVEHGGDREERREIHLHEGDALLRIELQRPVEGTLGCGVVEEAPARGIGNPGPEPRRHRAGRAKLDALRPRVPAS